MIAFYVPSVVGVKTLVFHLRPDQTTEQMFYHCSDMWVAYTAGERSRCCASCKGKCLMLSLSLTCDQASIVSFSYDF